MFDNFERRVLKNKRMNVDYRLNMAVDVNPSKVKEELFEEKT